MSKAAIIGGGVIGGGWAARFLLNGWDVAIFDPDPEAERKINAVLANARWALPMLYDRALPTEGRLTFAETLEDAVIEADWVQESVPERLELKHSVIGQVQAHEAGRVVVASSTSGFRPTELQEGASNPDAIIVAHPFNPVYLLPLVEVVAGEKTAASVIEDACETLRSIGMFPLVVRKEIDAHIADRFLEAVWREALWLIKDGVATTTEIDDAIRYGFGLRWAQMGLFETYRIAGGEGGMAHFVQQFGPALKWPWTKLMDVPDLTDDLIKMIGDQSDAQSGHLSIREMERLRDTNLIAMMRALKDRGNAAGKLIADHEKALPTPDASKVPFVTIQRTVPVDWTDYNDHMNESRYGQVFSDAADAVMVAIGADPDYIASGLSYFTVETSVKYVLETHASEVVRVETQIQLGEGKKLKLYHEMRRDVDGELLATCDQFLLHVSLETRKTCEPRADVAERLTALAATHSGR
jgi:carnitine 3-dehydrogenase